MSNAAANLMPKTCRIAPPDDATANNRRDAFGPSAPPESSPHNNLLMPQRTNLHESGLQRSPRLKEQAELKSKQQAKAHDTWAKKMPTVVTLFTLFSLVSDFCVNMPSNPISPTASFTEQMISKIHEVNELNDGTINSVVNYAFSTLDLDMSNSKVFTYTKALQQPDAAQFVKAMKKEIEDHKSRDHWETVPCSTIPEGMKTVQEIWSFRCKCFPNGSLNKYKARLCAHGGMQQWGASYWENLFYCC